MTAEAIGAARARIENGGADPETRQALFQLVAVLDRSSAEALERLGARIGGAAGAGARAAALLVAGRIEDLTAQMREDAELLRAAPYVVSFAPLPVEALAGLVAAWVEALRRGSSTLGSTAFRAFLGDVSEAVFRALERGADAGRLLGAGRSFFADTLSAELPGTTDFLAARAMAWLLGALARDEDGARAAIERARQRFHDPHFLKDCDAILSYDPWPPRQKT